ncbi:hypothetical protein ACFLV7_04600 [Chloroflexota bacterium]
MPLARQECGTAVGNTVVHVFVCVVWHIPVLISVPDVDADFDLSNIEPLILEDDDIVMRDPSPAVKIIFAHITIQHFEIAAHHHELSFLFGERYHKLLSNIFSIAENSIGRYPSEKTYHPGNMQRGKDEHSTGNWITSGNTQPIHWRQTSRHRTCQHALR